MFLVIKNFHLYINFFRPFLLEYLFTCFDRPRRHKIGMLWVRNYDDTLESWQRQSSISLRCIKKNQTKTKQNKNKKFNDLLLQDHK